MFNLTHW